MAQPSRMDVSISPPASNFCPSDWPTVFTAIANNLIVTPGLGFNGINIGPTAPANTDLPWFNTTVNDWYYWSTAAGAWVVLRPQSITGEVQIGTVTFWDGQISLINSVWGDRWRFANGDIVAINDYPDYFQMIGTKWGGDGVDTFGIIDVRNNFLVGAEQDDGGEAKTTVSDGAALTTERAYQDHWHQIQDQADPPYNGQTISFANGSAGNTQYPVIAATLADAAIPMRVLPPYKAAVPLVRVK